jgi:structure-specific recognition protein 1
MFALQPACDGGNFGDVVLNDSSLQMNSAKTGKSAFELKLHNVSQCVLPGNSKDEVEIQFYDNDNENQEEDCLVQIRMRFPGGDEEEDETPAEIFQKRIMERGMIQSVTGDVLAEFTEEQGTFITPRGRYAMQMYSTFLRMHGAKYDYKITYDDIGTIYLLHRPDDISSSIVISLEKPIRQGNQKYPFLVLQSNRLEHTMQVTQHNTETHTYTLRHTQTYIH